MDNDVRGKDRVCFHTPHWEIVLAAGDSAHPQFRRALGDLCETDWYSLGAYVRRHGDPPETARDRVHGFFFNLLEKRRLRVADPDLTGQRWPSLTSSRPRSGACAGW